MSGQNVLNLQPHECEASTLLRYQSAFYHGKQRQQVATIRR